MNAVIGICSFCELHGPSVLFCTQAFHDTEEGQWTQNVDADNKSDISLKSWYGPSFFAQRTGFPDSGSPPSKSDNCEGCTSMNSKKKGFISNDHEARVSYVSSQYPLHPDVFIAVRQACVRSLSCEVCPGREGPIFFGDDHRGHVLSHTFFLKDSQARGFQSWYSIIVVMRDKTFLLNSWQFLVKSLQQIIAGLQEKAEKVYAAEQSEQNLRAVRLNSVTRLTLDTFRRRRGNIKARSLMDLTSDKTVFSNLHLWFTWILKAGAAEISERLVESFPNEDTFIDLERQEETEEGFIKVQFSKSGTSTSTSLSASSQSDSSPIAADDILEDVIVFTSTRELFLVLGKEKFHCLAYHTIIGNQIIIRSKYIALTKSMINCLKDLLPRGCYHPINYSDTYEDSWKCNFLGISPSVKIPDHVNNSNLHIQINVTPKYESSAAVSNLDDLDFSFHTTATLPEKTPQVLSEMEKAIADQSFSSSALESFLFCTKEIWMNKVKVLFAFSRGGGQHGAEETTKLLTILGAQEHDKLVLKFWMTGLSTQYKTRILSSSVQQSGLAIAARN